MSTKRLLLALLVLIALAPFALTDVLAAKGGKKPKPPPEPTEPADPAIAYAGSGGLCVMDADGSNQTVLRSGDMYDNYAPAWSPDGDHIAFNDGDELWRIDVAVVAGVPQGSNAYRLHTGPAYNAQWSPDGTEIMYQGAGRGDGILAIPATGGSTRIVYTPASNCAVYFPCWSADGEQIAFFEYEPKKGTALKVLDVESDVVSTHLAHDASANFRFLEWGRTDDVLVYDDGTTGDVYLIDLVTSVVTTVVQGNKKRAATSPCWSADDTKLIFERSGIEVLVLSTGSTSRLARTGRFPDWKR